MNFASRDNAFDDNPSKRSEWRTIFRMMCKRRPSEQEMTMDMAGIPYVIHSFTSQVIYAPIPRSQAQNSHRRKYLAWLRIASAPEFYGDSFICFCRKFAFDEVNGEVRARRRRGERRHGVGVTMPFHLQDIFWGAFCGSFLPRHVGT